jgi:hypothetical protein
VGGGHLVSVWKQYRNVTIDGTDYANYDTEITVANPQEDPQEFEVALWNIPPKSFEAIETGKTGIRVELGWESGPQSQVLAGVIQKTRRSYDGSDIKYIVEGVDASEQALSSFIELQAFEDEPPETVIQAMAAEVGLSAEVDATNAPIRGYFNVYPRVNVQSHLDRLISEAGRLTGDTYEYWAQEGTLYFTKTNSTTPDTVPSLTYDSLLIEVSKIQDEDTDSETVDFKAMIDPRLNKGAQMRIETDRIEANYQVKTYEYQSSSVNGDHIVTGTAEKVGEPTPYDDVLEYTGGASTAGAIRHPTVGRGEDARADGPRNAGHVHRDVRGNRGC